MLDLVIFCKSYRGDLLRFQRLWASIQKHNVDHIPFYAAVPSGDLEFFRQDIEGSSEINWLTDEDIVEVSPGGSVERYLSLDGRLSQQIIKAEAWRKIGCENYVCLDSDCEFTRDFLKSNFIFENATPYTVMHQHKSFLQRAVCSGRDKHHIDWLRESNLLKKEFNRKGADFEFGPVPVIWSRRVWEDLESLYLREHNISLWTALENISIEIRWYGEALLRFKSIPIIPIEPLMLAYLYHWEFKSLRKCVRRDSSLYFGEVKQSNWDIDTDHASIKKRPLSRLLRKLKRIFR